MGILREPIRKPRMLHARKPNRKRFVAAKTTRGDCVQLEPKSNHQVLWFSLQKWGRRGCSEWFDPKLFADRDLKGHLPDAFVQPTFKPIDDVTISQLRSLDLLNRERWYQIVHWVSGQKAADEWRTELLKYSLANKPTCWLENARQLHRHLSHLHRECQRLGVRCFADQFYRLWPRTTELVQSVCDEIVSLQDKLNWPEQSKIRSWIAKSLEAVQTRIMAHDGKKHVLIPASFAAWFVSDVCKEAPPTILHEWLPINDNGGRLSYFWELLDRSTAKERRRLVHRQNFVLETSTFAWRAIARAERAPKRLGGQRDIKYFERINANTPLELELSNATGKGWCLQFSRDRNRVYRPWLNWLRQWPQKTVHNEMSDQWSAILKRVDVLIQLRPELGRAWADWLHATEQQASKSYLAPPVASELDATTKAEFARLFVFRRILGFHTAIPKSSPLSGLDPIKRKREIEYLSQLHTGGTISPKAALRLDYLQNQSAPRMPCATSIRRRLTQASFNAALQAVTQWVRYREHQQLRQLKSAWAETLGPREQLELLKFLATLERTTREMLCEALQKGADAKHGHRDIGQRNQAWIHFAKQRGLQWEQWVSSEPTHIKCPVAFDGEKATNYKRLKIHLSNDPRHVLWMGRPFDSCLDLVDGAYAASVVANWMDANKQLLVVVDEHGNMLARRLLAITDKMELLTYRIYSSIETPVNTGPGTLNLAMDEYCDQIATKTGTVRVAEGLPRRLHGSQWYNDGPIGNL